MTATLDRVVVSPVKSLGPCEPGRATVRENGGRSFDRECAMLDGAAAYVDDENDRRVHRLRSWFDPDTGPPIRIGATISRNDRTTARGRSGNDSHRSV